MKRMEFGDCKMCNDYKMLEKNRLCVSCYNDLEKGYIVLEFDRMQGSTKILKTLMEKLEEDKRYIVKHNDTSRKTLRVTEGYIAVKDTTVSISTSYSITTEVNILDIDNAKDKIDSLLNNHYKCF